MELSIKEVVRLLYKRLKVIMLCTVVCAGALYTCNQYVRDPVYSASVQLYVNAYGTSSNENLNDLNYAQKVVNTYINFLRTQEFYRQVLETTKLSYTVEQLQQMTSIGTVNATEIFEISVTTKNPKHSYELVKAMQDIAPNHIGQIKDNTKIRVVDPVVMPMKPSGPNVLLNTVLGGAVGFLLAFVGVIIQKLFDVKVKEKEELETRYKHPILGVIPKFTIHNKERMNGKMKRWHSKKSTKVKQVNTIIAEESDFIITEAYKSLRTNLRYTLREVGCKTLLINSPMPGEGKSTTCANIAITIAQTGAKVLVMDCDLRKGRIHKAFGIKNTIGVSDMISGLHSEKEVIRASKYENVFVITMGTIPPNPTELLSSAALEMLIRAFERSFDYILIDSPPVNLVSDALSLSKLVDGVLMVAKEDITTHPNVEMALNKYSLVDANILGFVFNAVNMSKTLKSKKNYYYGNSDD